MTNSLIQSSPVDFEIKKILIDDPAVAIKKTTSQEKSNTSITVAPRNAG
jgi:hypothetical protein